MNVEEKKILPLGNADINVYPIYSNAVSVLNLHSEVNEWLLCNFIQLASNGRALLFYDFNYKTCPYLKIQRIAREYLSKRNIDILDFIIQNISFGCYVYLLIRRSDIMAYNYESTEERQRDDFAHDIFVYGYDSEKRIFYVCDNFKNGKYSREVCTFEEFRTAFENVSPKYEGRLGFMGNVELWQYYDKCKQSFNLDRVQDSFQDYLNSNATAGWSTMDCTRDKYAAPRFKFGLECYDYLKNRVINTRPEDVYIQDFHLLWEHKKHIRKICLYLLEQEFIWDTGLIEVLDGLCKEALIIRNLMVKYMVSGKKQLQISVITKLERLEQSEKCVLERVLQNIKDCCNSSSD